MVCVHGAKYIGENNSPVKHRIYHPMFTGETWLHEMMDYVYLVKHGGYSSSHLKHEENSLAHLYVKKFISMCPQNYFVFTPNFQEIFTDQTFQNLTSTKTNLALNFDFLCLFSVHLAIFLKSQILLRIF